MAVTQKEIARRLGVSTSLVSRSLSGQGERIGASEETVRRICVEAERLGYQPHAAALVLRGRPSRTLGVIVRDFTDPYLGRLIGEIQRLARSRGYALVLAGGENRQALAGDLDALLRYRPDGLLLCGSDLGLTTSDLQAVSNLPCAQIGSGPHLPGVAQIGSDEKAGLRELVDHLWALGHRAIAFLGNGSETHRRRAAVLRSLLAGRGSEVPAGRFLHIPAGDEASAELASALERLLGAPPAGRPTALIAGDDETALATLRGLHERGVRVPQELSLAGMDDIPAARLAIPALTTIRLPLSELASRAFAHATGDPDAAAGDAPVPALVMRESCMAPAGGTMRNGLPRRTP